MRQVFHNVANGNTDVVDVPAPDVRSGHLLIETRRSLVSAGTERTLAEFGRASWVGKARQQPDKVRMVLDKIRADGLAPAFEAVQARLNEPVPLGYCNVGVVLEVGAGVERIGVGDRVVSNGHHAEIVCVPKNLCARIPDVVSDDAAAFTVLGAIGLQGIRLARPTLGENFVVIGLGLIGLLTVRLLRAYGCRVLGIDLDVRRLELARSFGAEVVNLAVGEDPLVTAQFFSRGCGVDGVLITAATRSNEPVHQAAQMCRKRGRIVLVGVTGLSLSRTDFYEKELLFQVSCSYGPGRYDPAYEHNGQDYPIGFVRWTEKRNFEAVLDMMADGRLDVASLISHRLPMERAADAYTLLTDRTPTLGIMLEYPRHGRVSARERSVPLGLASSPSAADPRVSFVGAGNYAGRVLIPAFKAAGASLKALASSGGVSSARFGRKYGFEVATTDTDSLLGDGQSDIVVVATRHDTHGRLVMRALRAGKHVFVEKPLALTDAELAEIDAAYREAISEGRGRLLMVGFNRRFAPQVQEMKRLLDNVMVPKAFVVTVNAGEVPPNHWTQDRVVGGGRIAGEACHFVDLLRFLVGTPITGAQVTAMGKVSGMVVRDDKVSFTLSFADGSFGTVHYLANGHRAFPKERLEVFCAGRILQLDNFRRLRAWGWPRFRGSRRWRQDKGQQACVNEFLDAVRTGGKPPIPYEELQEVSRWTLRIADEASR